jgi:hypothetical protein
MSILIKIYFFIVCFIAFNTHSYAIEAFEKLGQQSAFKSIDITIRNPTIYHGANLCMTDKVGRVTLSPKPGQIDKNALINIHMSNLRAARENIKQTEDYSKDIPIRINHSMCNTLNDYGNLVLQAYINATQTHSDRRQEFHQLYQGFYDLITSNEEGKIILRDIIDSVSFNLQAMNESTRNKTIPDIAESLIIVPPLTEKTSLTMLNKNMQEQWPPLRDQFFHSQRLAHPLATGALSFVIVGGIGYLTLDTRSALFYATLSGVIGGILPQFVFQHISKK